MSLLYLALAALVGSVVGAPVWVLAWARRARAVRLAAAIRTRIRAVLTVAALATRAVAGAVRHHRVRQTLAGLAKPHTGRHTPRGGTPVPTATQIKEATA